MSELELAVVSVLEESELAGLAEAIHGAAAIPTPMPSATAEAPTRPMNFAFPMIESLRAMARDVVAAGSLDDGKFVPSSGCSLLAITLRSAWTRRAHPRVYCRGELG